MRLLRLHLTIAMLIIGMSALGVSGSPLSASKKKAKSTTSSKSTQTSSKTKSKKSQKEEPKQAKNSHQKPVLKQPPGGRNAKLESEHSTQTASNNSSRKGKKGFAVPSSQVAEQPPARVIPAVNQQKTVAPVTPLTTTSPGFEPRSSLPARTADNDNQPSAPLPVPVAPTSNQPDRLDVIEYRDASRSSSGRASTAPPPPSRIFGISARRVDVDIDTPRVIQIQKALKDKGFYSIEPTGVYDEDTINAMKAFQQNEHIDVTGYPTAHALKRLGL